MGSPISLSSAWKQTIMSVSSCCLQSHKLPRLAQITRSTRMTHGCGSGVRTQLSLLLWILSQAGNRKQAGWWCRRFCGGKSRFTLTFRAAPWHNGPDSLALWDCGKWLPHLSSVPSEFITAPCFLMARGLASKTESIFYMIYAYIASLINGENAPIFLSQLL